MAWLHIEADEKITQEVLSRILRGERPGLVDRIRARIKSGLTALFCRGMMPSWVVGLLFRILRLRVA